MFFLYLLSDSFACFKADSAVTVIKLFNFGSIFSILSKKELTKSTEEKADPFNPSNCSLIDNSKISDILFAFINYLRNHEKTILN